MVFRKDFKYLSSKNLVVLRLLVFVQEAYVCGVVVVFLSCLIAGKIKKVLINFTILPSNSSN